MLEWCSDEVVSKCRAWLADAKASTTDELILRRTHLDEAVLHFAELMRRYREQVRRIQGPQEPDGEAPEFAEAQRRAEAVRAYVAAERWVLTIDKYIRAYLSPVQTWRRIHADISSPW